MNEVLRAARLAAYYHKGQYRKWVDKSGLKRPYILHPARVAGLTIIHQDAFLTRGAWMEDIASAAWLHDVLEDCCDKVDEFILQELMGDHVVHLVKELTNDDHNLSLPRDQRKRRDCNRIRMISTEAKIIKALDRLDNLRDLPTAPPDFVRLYHQESMELMDVLAPAIPSIINSEIEAELDALRHLFSS